MDKGYVARTPEARTVHLTARRILIIRHLAYDRDPAEIAHLLGIKRDSVYEHLGEIRRRLQVRTCCGVVGAAYRLGLLEASTQGDTPHPHSVPMYQD